MKYHRILPTDRVVIELAYEEGATTGEVRGFHKTQNIHELVAAEQFQINPSSVDDDMVRWFGRRCAPVIVQDLLSRASDFQRWAMTGKP